MRKRIKHGNFCLVAGIGSGNGWAAYIFIVVDVSFASIHYSKYGRAYPLSDHIPTTKQKFPFFILKVFNTLFSHDAQSVVYKQSSVTLIDLGLCHPLHMPHNSDIVMKQAAMHTNLWFNRQLTLCTRVKDQNSYSLGQHDVCLCQSRLVNGQFGCSGSKRNFQILIITLLCFESES